MKGLNSWPSLNQRSTHPETIPGDHAGGATPVPIPNTEVKSSRADDTAAARLWESRTLPGFYEPIGHFGLWAFFLVVGTYGFLLLLENRCPSWVDDSSPTRVKIPHSV